MELDKYQELAFSAAQYPKTVDDVDSTANVGLLYAVLGLAGEAGELCNKVKKVLRDSDGVLTKERKQQLQDELGDCMWYVAAVATELGIDLSEVCTGNVNKLFDRKERGVIKGDGDNR